MKREIRRVELLVVFVAGGLLLAGLGAVGKTARERAKGVVCLANLGQLGKGWHKFAEEHQGELIGGDTIGNDWEYTALGMRQHNDWVDYPQDEYGYWIPIQDMTYEDRVRGIQRGSMWNLLKNLNVYHCPNDDRYFNLVGPAAGYRSYSIQSLLNGHDWFADYCQIWPVRKFSQIRNPETKYVFIEEAERDVGYNARSWSFDPFGQVPLENGWWELPAIFHDNKSTFGYTDGHASMYSWQCDEVIQASIQGIKYFSCSDGANCPDLIFMQQNTAHNGPM